MSNDRKAAVTLGVLVLVMLGAVYGLTHLGGISPGKGTRPAVRSAPTTTSRLPATTTTTAAPAAYQVQRGDTLTGIARRFGVTTQAIVATNHLTAPDHLAVGQSLRVPPPPPRLIVTPAEVTAGKTVELQLTGARPSETVIFVIDSPAGHFAGPAHQAGSDGTVTASYRPESGAAPGTYTVAAKGDHGTSLRATFRVDRSSL